LQAGLADESPIFDECPTFCDAEQKERSSFCGSCPIGTARNEFREQTTEVLDEMPGSRFGFDYLNQCLVNAMLAGDLPPERWTVTTARLRAIVEGERTRIARLKKWNADQSKKPDA